MAVKEADEDDLMNDDDDDDDDARSTSSHCSGTADRKSKHKCSRKPTVSYQLITYRLITCLENLEMSGNFADVKEMSGTSVKFENCHSKHLIVENCPKKLS